MLKPSCQNGVGFSPMWVSILCPSPPTFNSDFLAARKALKAQLSFLFYYNPTQNEEKKNVHTLRKR